MILKKNQTVRQALNEQTEALDHFIFETEQLRKEVMAVKTFMIETQISMAKNIQDLHNRLNYIKTYIGVDEFFEAVKNKQDDTSSYLE